MQAGFNYQAFILMVQACEALGAVLDDKPLKAIQQSKLRFLKVFRKFPKHYFELADDDFWYDQLRNNIAHLLIPGGHIKISEIESNHLVRNNIGVIHIYIPTFYHDFLNTFHYFLNAFNRQNGKVKVLNFNNMDQFV
jgi:hypothetical protein